MRIEKHKMKNSIYLFIYLFSQNCSQWGLRYEAPGWNFRSKGVSLARHVPDLPAFDELCIFFQRKDMPISQCVPDIKKWVGWNNVA